VISFKKLKGFRFKYWIFDEIISLIQRFWPMGCGQVVQAFDVKNREKE